MSTRQAAPLTEIPVAPGRPGRAFAGRLLSNYGMVLVLVALVIAAQLSYDKFLTLTNIENTITQNAGMAIVAVGMTYVIIGGGFDLSVTGTFGLGSVLFAQLAYDGLAIPAALAVAVTAGAGCGLLNGLLVNRVGVNPFVTTLGTATVFLGVAALYSDMQPIMVPAEVTGFDTLGTGEIAGIAIPVFLIALAFLGGGFVLRRTPYGRSLYAVGGNREAARLCGLSVERISIVSYVLVAALAGLAGAVLASDLSTGAFDSGPNVALDAVAAVIIGGNALFGGEGAMWRTLVGVLILATINNLFSSLSMSSATQDIVKGLVVVGAVAADAVARRARRT